MAVEAPVRKARRIQGVSILDRTSLAEHRLGLLLVSVIPLVGVGVAIWTLWGRGLSPADAAIALSLYVFTGLGVTVGFHRMLAHKTFESPNAVRAVLAVAGSMSIEMGAIDWAATHRRHHAYSDQPGDPHSPHLQAENGWRGIVKGLWYAHMGWLFSNERTSRERWTPDLLKDPAMVKITDLFPFFVITSFVLPAILGLAITRSFTGMLSAFLWGGLVRIFLLHHVTFSINSLCHFLGKRPYETKEKSVNVWPLALLSFGESWHNNHHAFPGSAFLGLRGWQLDPGQWLLRILGALGLARNIKRPTRDEILPARAPA
jgi:stearoyl-CoA desaturase (delta-9 desaturase)